MSKVKLNVRQACLENRQCLKFDLYYIYMYIYIYIVSGQACCENTCQTVIDLFVIIQDIFFIVIYYIFFIIISIWIIPDVRLRVHVLGIQCLWRNKYMHTYIHVANRILFL